MDDPVVERLDEALADARAKLNRVIASGRIPDESLRMLIEVRQDLVFMARETVKSHKIVNERLEELDEQKVDKNPNTVWLYRTLIATALASAFGLVVWLIQGGPS